MSVHIHIEMELKPTPVEIFERLIIMSFRSLMIYAMFCFFFSGCSGGYTEVRLRGITKYEVNQSLWNVGGYDELVWPDIRKVNKQKTVIRHKDTVSTPIFSTSRNLIDTIKIENDETNRLIVSLQCKQSEFLQWSKYRNKIREHQILWKMTQKLQEEENASVECGAVEWIGDWKPRNEPIIITDENTKWIAYHNDALLTETGFLNYFHPEFVKSNLSVNKRVIYQRWISRDHIDDFLFPEPGQESYEKIIIKLVPHEDAYYKENTAIVIGVAAKGVEYKKKFFSYSEKYTDISENLLNSMMNRIVEEVFWSSSDTLFLDPSPWIEMIELPDLVNHS